MARQEEKNKALLGCIAKQYGWDVAESFAADLTVAGVSEMAGPEVGLPVTILYVAIKGSKAVKIISTASGINNIVGCILKTQ